MYFSAVYQALRFIPQIAKFSASARATFTFGKFSKRTFRLVNDLPFARHEGCCARAVGFLLFGEQFVYAGCLRSCILS